MIRAIHIRIRLRILLNLLIFTSILILGENMARSAPPSTPAPKGQAIAVEALKKEYWQQNQSTDDVYKVVQNRAFLKKNKMEFGAILGIVSSDPFVSDNNVGGALGYYISEDLQLNLTGWYDISGPSGALNNLIAAGTTTNSNTPKWYGGFGVEYSPIYGKVSFLGSKILHYDLHVSIGGGLRGTDAGNFITGMIGIGQIFFISKVLGLRFDYRMSFYSEAIYEKVNPARLGQYNNNRLNRGDILTFGISAFF